ncbi:flagellin N-terminal helical domain-containing protein [Cellulosilyticum ruminicola]|uniref:flagellin N-terminal helical domain-containing protein n=1 Tax=Cellulosilyticum ruminicola TaxID=425254 RepID=UPI0006D013DC|nr:flagellin [Cellulosilyticum ruminicola]
MIINHNMNAMNAHRNSTLNITATGKHMEKLSSGLRINRAADDAAGLSISEKMRGQIKGLNQAKRNTQDGISYIQTAEGALTEVSDMLTRMKELTVQKANGTYNTDDISNLELEMTQLGGQIDKIIGDTKFNGINVFSGEITIVVNDADTNTLTVGTTLAAQNLGAASTTANVETSITTINQTRSTLGAQQNRLEYTSNNLGTTAENLTASESRIRDTDMAKEMAEFSSKNIITQASQAMLAQANQLQQGVLSLLR